MGKGIPFFMYMGRALRAYQNWSRVFVCEDTTVSKELIHKRASCKQNCCLDTIWPTQVVAMARPERMDPSRFSLRSVTEAMPTPRSKTKRESLILSLHKIELVLAQWKQQSIPRG